MPHKLADAKYPSTVDESRALLVYSSSISNKNLSISAFGVGSNAVSAIFFDAILTRPILPI